jgi:hypothetical protein
MRRNVFIAFLCAVPPLLAFWVTWQYAVFVPTKHYFEYLPLAEDILLRGYPSWSALLLRVNEHSVITYNVLFALAGMAHPSLLPLSPFGLALYTYASHVCAAVTALCVWLISRRKTGALLFITFVIMFSPAQWIIWIQPYVGFTLETTLAAIVMLLLDRYPHSRGAFGASIALTIVASFGVAAGLGIWPAALAVLWGNRRKVWIWLGSAACVSVVFFALSAGNLKPVSAGRLVHVPLFFLTLLGARQWSDPLGAGVLGAAFCVLLSVAAWRLRGSWTRAAPWMGLCVFALCAALMIAIGRQDRGIVYAVHPQYVAFTCVGWIALIHLLALSFRRNTVLVCLAGVFLLHAYAWRAALPEYARWHAELLRSQACLARYETASDECLGRLTYGPAWGDDVRRSAAKMRRLGLLSSPGP